jgi:peptidoglycan/LPS O-acetylase OafA/YrhL
MSQLRYRADIDGLRAVAVLGVIAYHAAPGLLPGGFTGVDIFFVISGYLISGILYRSLLSEKFTFREFYARRIRRLFPALITLLILTLAYGWVLLLPDEFRCLGKQVAAGTFFLQNFVLWQESGYFDVSATLKPLLHLWSLAVEEQFYILFPPVMILLWKKRWPFVPVIGVLIIGSFALNLVMSFQDPVPDFFLTPYRSWEFLVGALLAWYHFGKGHADEKHGFWMASLGILLIGIGLTVLRSGEPYPGWRALLPVAGSLLLIGAGPSSWINRYFLSLRPLVLVGLVSYPLYLFHWPLLSCLHIVRGSHPPVQETLVVLLLSGILSVATYLLVEKPLRHHPSRRFSFAVLWVCLSGPELSLQSPLLPKSPESGRHLPTMTSWKDFLIPGASGSTGSEVPALRHLCSGTATPRCTSPGLKNSWAGIPQRGGGQSL